MIWYKLDSVPFLFFSLLFLTLTLLELSTHYQRGLAPPQKDMIPLFIIPFCESILNKIKK